MDLEATTPHHLELHTDLYKCTVYYALVHSLPMYGHGIRMTCFLPPAEYARDARRIPDSPINHQSGDTVTTRTVGLHQRAAHQQEAG